MSVALLNDHYVDYNTTGAGTWSLVFTPVAAGVSLLISVMTRSNDRALNSITLTPGETIEPQMYSRGPTGGGTILKIQGFEAHDLAQVELTLTLQWDGTAFGVMVVDEIQPCTFVAGTDIRDGDTTSHDHTDTPMSGSDVLGIAHIWASGNATFNALPAGWDERLATQGRRSSNTRADWTFTNETLPITGGTPRSSVASLVLAAGSAPPPGGGRKSPLRGPFVGPLGGPVA